MQKLMFVACVIGFVGCAEKVDPRLCEICRKLAVADRESGPNARSKRDELRDERDHRITATAAFYGWKNTGTPQANIPHHFDCPECDAEYAKILEYQRGR